MTGTTPAMSGTVPTRILKEIKSFEKDMPQGIKATINEDNVRHIKFTVDGPEGSFYEGGKFNIELWLPTDYPFRPPMVHFTTKIYHPNIDRQGRVCLSTLKDSWTPAQQMKTVMLSIQVLLSDPNPYDPLDNNVATHWKDDLKGAEAQAREWTNLYATEKQS